MAGKCMVTLNKHHLTGIAQICLIMSSCLVVSLDKSTESQNVSNPVIIVSTYPDMDSISQIATKVIKSGLAACVNVSAISSFYLWDGKVMENEQEQIAIFKTAFDRKDALKEVINQTHPYDVPEIIEISTSDVNSSYMNWLVSSTRGNNSTL